MKSLKKEIEAVEKEMNETEKRWLHDQVDLVKIGKEKEEIEAKVSSSKDKVYIFTRKLFRIEGNVAIHCLFLMHLFLVGIVKIHLLKNTYENHQKSLNFSIKTDRFF